MNSNVLTMSKKALTWWVVGAAILWSMSASFVVAPLTAKAADVALSAGNLIRGTVKSPYGGYPVYFYGSDGKKALFSTEVTYKTWYSDFSAVKVLSQAQLESIPGSDKNVTYRPGSYVVKFEGESNLYVIEKGAMIRKLSDAVAKELYGVSYVASQIPSAFRANYTSSTDVTVAADYNKAAAMASAPDISTNMGGSAVTPTVGAMSVSLASDNPAGAVLPSKSSGVTLMKFNLASSSGASVTGMTFKRVGVGATSDFANLYLYDGSKRLTTGRSIQSTTNEVQFSSLNVMVAAGGTKTLSLVGDLAVSPTSGDTHGFSVTSVASTASVSGTPVTGSTFSIGSQPVSVLTVTKGTTPSNPTVGQKGATISEFKLQAGTNDVEVRRVALIQSGTIPNGDLANLELWQGGAKIASVSSMDGDKMRFVLDAPMTIPQGATRIFTVKADVSGYGSRTIITYVEYESDIYAVDKSYNFGACVDTGANTCTTSAAAGTFYSSSTISITTQGGKATIAFNGPSASDVSVGTQDALLYKFSLTAGDQALDIRNLRITVDAVNGTGTGRLAEAATAFVTDVALKNMDTGARIDTKELGATADTGNMTTKDLTFNNSFTIAAGTTVNFGVTADMKNTDDTNFVGQGVKITLKAFSSGDIKELNTNQNVTDIVPNAAIAGYTMTVKASALTVQLASTPVASTAVRGAKGVEMVGFSFAAGTQSDVKVTSITMTGTGALDENDDDTIDAAAAADLSKVILSASLWDGAVQVGTAKSPDSTAGTLTFDNLNWTVSAGQTKKLLVKADVATSITGLSDVAATAFVGIATAGGVSAQDKDSNTVTATDGDSTWSGPVNSMSGTYLTVKNTGKLTLDVDGDTAKASIIVGGANDVPMAKFKFSSTDESFWVKKLRINNNTSSDDAVITQVKVTYPKQDGTMETKTAVLSGGNADLSDLNFYVPVNKNVVLSVSADLGAITTSGITGLTPQMRIDFNGTFEAVGAQSGASLNEGSDIHATSGQSTACSDGWAVSSTCYADTGTATGNEMTVRKTKPTVTLAANSPSGASVPGLNEVLRFTVAADAAGDVVLDVVTFAVTSTDNAGTPTGWNVEGDSSGVIDATSSWSLYESTDLTTILEAGDSDWTLYATTGAALASSGLKIGYAKLDLTTKITIAAGTSKTFVLKVDTTGASSASDDTVRFDVQDENGGGVTITGNEFTWDETGYNGAATGIAGTGVKNIPVNGGTIVY